MIPLKVLSAPAFCLDLLVYFYLIFVPRYNIFRKAWKYHDQDGLNSLQYKVLERTNHPLYTKIKVDLQKHKDKLMKLLESSE